MFRSIVLIPLFCVFVLGSSAQEKGQVKLPQLAPGFVIEANGKPIEVLVGHAAPYMIDFNGDGRKDLVVGEFGTDVVNSGRARVYLNVGTDENPQFKDFTYLQAGGRDAMIPSSCCIGFDPFFLDLNGDGIMDVTSGQYTGGYINFYEGVGKNAFQFKEGVNILQPELEDEATRKNMKWWMRTANFIDYDGDGDYDMVWGNVHAEVYYAENIGTRTAYKFANSVPLTMDGHPIYVDGKSDPFPVDWDGDGIIDLLVAAESSDVLFFKGKKKGGTDFEPGVSIWTGRKLTPGVKPNFKNEMDALAALGEQCPYPGYRTRLGVADWNNDGKLDLLVGNCFKVAADETGKGGGVSGSVYVFLRK